MSVALEYFTENNIPYQVRYSKRSRNAKIIFQNGFFELVVPSKRDVSILDDVVNENQDWILSRWVEISKIRSLYSIPDKLHDGVDFPFLGEYKKLHVEFIDIIIPKIQFSDKIQISFPLHYAKKNITYEAATIILKFLKNYLRNFVESELENLQRNYGLKYNKLSIKSQSSRWGSCSYQKNINLNLNLVFAPASIQKYVIIHEYCHLKYLDHSNSFWQMVETIDHDYNKHRKWLKQNAHIIYFIANLEKLFLPPKINS